MTTISSSRRSVVAIAAVTAVIATMATRLDAAGIAITEWMYSQVAGPGEYIEITNVSPAPISLTGWSQDDNNRNAGVHPLGSLGTLAPGESAILTEGSSAATFRTYWGLSGSVKVLAYGTMDNLGRADEINIYDNTNALVDRLTYDDQTIGGFRTQGTSANISLAQLFQNHANLAISSTVPDAFLSYRGDGGTVGQDIGNPGIYTPFVVPEPSSIVMAAAAMLLCLSVMPRRRDT